MTRFISPQNSAPVSETPIAPGRWRVPALLLAALTQAGCVAAAMSAAPLLMGTDLANPLHDAVDRAAQRRVEEQYRQQYPGVDISDEYALARAMYEKAQRENPEEMGHLGAYPSRAAWEANNAKTSGVTAASPGTSATSATAAAATPTASPTRMAQDRAVLKKDGTPWVVVTKSWPYDMLNFSTVAPYTCGFSRLQYSVNGGETKTQAFTPCFASNAKPNPPYLTFPQGSIETVRITMHFTDGGRQTREFQRDEIFQR